MTSSSSMSTLSPPLPNTTPSISTRRNKFFHPLSDHGLPKPPPTSPGGSFRSHRFSPTPSSPPMSPKSPLMSAKSFGTFIESEPSTPAYSPRPETSNWDNSTLVLLSPVSLAPSSPPEPKWEMLAPTKKATQASDKNRTSFKFSKDMFSNPVRPILEEPQRETVPPIANETAADPDAETKSQEEQSLQAPLDKLASRVKSILRRKPGGDKKSEKKINKKSEKRRRAYEDLDRMEDVHWTEM